MKGSGIDLEADPVTSRPSFSPVPSWELQRARFDIRHTDLKKEDNINLLASQVKCHIEDLYSDHLKVFTDGSVIERQAGSAFLIPALKIEKSFNIGLNKSVFTAELFAILMALNHIINSPRTLPKILFCVDSKSVLQALELSKLQTRSEMILEITHLINSLCLRGIDITFCWIPSHSFFHYNDMVDRAAKRGAKSSPDSNNVQLSLSLHECYTLVDSYVWKQFEDKQKKYKNCYMNFEISKTLKQFPASRSIQSLMYRWKLDAFKTKYTRNIVCLCGKKITHSHILSCVRVKRHIPTLSQKVSDIFASPSLTYEFFVSLSKSPIANYL